MSLSIPLKGNSRDRRKRYRALKRRVVAGFVRTPFVSRWGEGKFGTCPKGTRCTVNLPPPKGVLTP